MVLLAVVALSFVQLVVPVAEVSFEPKASVMVVMMAEQQILLVAELFFVQLVFRMVVPMAEL